MMMMMMMMIITKLDHYLGDSTDAKTPFSFLKIYQIA